MDRCLLHIVNFPYTVCILNKCYADGDMPISSVFYCHADGDMPTLNPDTICL